VFFFSSRFICNSLVVVVEARNGGKSGLVLYFSLNTPHKSDSITQIRSSKISYANQRKNSTISRNARSHTKRQPVAELSTRPKEDKEQANEHEKQLSKIHRLIYVIMIHMICLSLSLMARNIVAGSRALIFFSGMHAASAFV
jgi:hypothetical protein